MSLDTFLGTISGFTSDGRAILRESGGILIWPVENDNYQTGESVIFIYEKVIPGSIASTVRIIERL